MAASCRPPARPPPRSASARRIPCCRQVRPARRHRCPGRAPTGPGGGATALPPACRTAGVLPPRGTPASRRDYTVGGQLHYNVDEYKTQPSASDGGLSGTAARKLLRHQCSTRDDLGRNRWFWHLTLTGPAPYQLFAHHTADQACQLPTRADRRVRARPEPRQHSQSVLGMLIEPAGTSPHSPAAGSSYGEVANVVDRAVADVVPVERTEAGDAAWQSSWSSSSSCGLAAPAILPGLRSW